MPHRGPSICSGSGISGGITGGGSIKGPWGGSSGTESGSHFAQHRRQNQFPSHSLRPSQHGRPSSQQRCLQASHSLSSMRSGSARTPCCISRLQHRMYEGPKCRGPLGTIASLVSLSPGCQSLASPKIPRSSRGICCLRLRCRGQWKRWSRIQRNVMLIRSCRIGSRGFPLGTMCTQCCCMRPSIVSTSPSFRSTSRIVFGSGSMPSAFLSAIHSSRGVPSETLTIGQSRSLPRKSDSSSACQPTAFRPSWYRFRLALFGQASSPSPGNRFPKTCAVTSCMILLNSSGLPVALSESLLADSVVASPLLSDSLLWDWGLASTPPLSMRVPLPYVYSHVHPPQVYQHVLRVTLVPLVFRSSTQGAPTRRRSKNDCDSSLEMARGQRKL
mmetsp:Transcript_43004/g.121683  ORF Transcript_43004/g.121683 Transcript_43004/m.121683 type:complete len:386 (-) Transcript_43004:271-1428(-)